jgi:hypothetical protein
VTVKSVWFRQVYNLLMVFTVSQKNIYNLSQYIRFLTGILKYSIYMFSQLVLATLSV